METSKKTPEVEWAEARSALLRWYERGSRGLPWRETNDPYAILLAEVMLQQTRVEVVERRYTGFLFQFPDTWSLAQASEDALMKAWEGLGYYSRARNLHRAMQEVCERYAGEIPSRKEDLLALPGIGAYTAAAVLSIAFGQPEAAIDANAERIIARLLAMTDNPRSAEPRRRIERALLDLMPVSRSADFTQAIMDLGQLVCTPKRPSCEACPWAFCCRGQKNPERFPCRPLPRAKTVADQTVAVLTDGEKLALMKRPANVLLASMYGPLTFEGCCSAEDIISRVEELGYVVETVERIPSWKHTFTHIVWQLSGFIVRVSQPLARDNLVWADDRMIDEEMAVPTAFAPVPRVWMQWKKEQNG